MASKTAAEMKKWALQVPLEAAEQACAELEQDPRRCAWEALRVIRRRLSRERAEMSRLECMCKYEHAARRDGYSLIAGVDEVGRGPLAGPVVAAAVLFTPDLMIPGLNDSKQVTETKRLELYGQITKRAMCTAVALKSARYIDEHNIAVACFAAMREALSALVPGPEYVLVDGFRIPSLAVPQNAIVGGDALCCSIAAASIVAKAYRDRLMQQLHEQYPVYGFARNKGYATREHLMALRRYGACAEHRMSFSGVCSLQMQLQIERD